MRWLIREAIFVIFVVFVGSVLEARIQVVPLASPHWQRESAIRVWTDSSGAPQGAVALVEKALQTWTRAADGRLTLSRTLARDEAAITVTFVTGDGIYGEAAPRVDSAKRFIVAAAVAINAGVPPDPVDARIVVYLTALHELGHALGLAHTDNFRDIMYRFQKPDDGERYFGAYKKLLTSVADIGSPTATGLSPQDVARLRALYDR